MSVSEARLPIYTVTELLAAGHSPKNLRLPPRGRVTPSSGASKAKRELRTTIIALAHNASWHVREEFQFLPKRRYKADWAIAPLEVWEPAYTVLIEYEGGAWQEVNEGQVGKHQGERFVRDCIKYNLASLAGYTLLRFTADMVTSGLAAQQIAQAIWRVNEDTSFHSPAGRPEEAHLGQGSSGRAPEHARDSQWRPDL